MTVAAPSASASSVSISSLATSYVANDNRAGGVGDVRASWRNHGAALSQIGLIVPAPSGFYFQRSGTLTIYQLDRANNVWRNMAGPSLEASCSVTDGGTLLNCDALPVFIPAETTFAVGIPTYIARSTPVTGAMSFETGLSALLNVGEARVQSPIAAAVSGIAESELTTSFPVTGSRLISGTADPGTTAMVYDAAGRQLGSALTTTDRTWRLTLDPGHGTIHILFRTVDGAQVTGSSGYFNSYTFTVSSPRAGTSWPASPKFIGVGQPGSVVSIRDALDRELVNGTVDSSGSWSLQTPVTLQPGAHELLVVNTISDGSATSVPMSGVVVDPSVNAPSAPTPDVDGLPAPELAVTVGDSGAVANGEAVRMVRVIVTNRSGLVAGARVRFDTPEGLHLSIATAVTDLRGEAFTTIAATHTRQSKIVVTVGETTTTTPVRFARH